MPEKPIHLRQELAAAVARISDSERAALVDLGIPPDDLGRYRLCGIERVSISNGLYAPALDGTPAIITPVRVWRAASLEAPRPRLYSQWGPIIDLVAWHPAAPRSFALRVGAAEWLGLIEPQFMDPDPVPIHQSVLDWLRAGRVGLVLLSHDPGDQYRALSACRSGIVAADEAHARTLRRAMHIPWTQPRVEVAHVAT